MRSRSPFLRAVPGVLLALTLAAMAAALVVGDLNGDNNADESFAEEILLIAAFMAFPVVGSLIASRQPRNAIGWMLLGVGAMVAFGVLGDEWARYSFVTRDEPLPFATLGAWIAAWFWIPMIGTIPTTLLLLFPTGRLPSRHIIWRLTLWTSVVLISTITVLLMFEETLNFSDYDVANPIGISGLEDVEDNVPFLVLAPLVLLSAASLVVRFFRAQGDERQQLKWVMLAATIFAIGITLGDLFRLPDVLFPIVLVTLPVAIAVAVLKYRLYDISVVVNKTIVYTLLSAILAAVYMGLVFLLRAALPIGEQSQVTVAASTLAVAGLFRPLRRRLQDAIDHLFYRSKYDSVHAVDAFSARLRNEVDLEALTSELLGIIDQTIRPAHASLWLRAAVPAEAESSAPGAARTPGAE